MTTVNTRKGGPNCHHSSLSSSSSTHSSSSMSSSSSSSMSSSSTSSQSSSSLKATSVARQTFIVMAFISILTIRCGILQQYNTAMIDTNNNNSRSRNTSSIITTELSSNFTFQAVSSQQQEQEQQKPEQEPNDNRIAVFYNLFISSKDDVERVQREIVQDQMIDINPSIHGPIYVTSLGYPVDAQVLFSNNETNVNNNPPLEIIHQQQLESGTEMETLHSLWTYCRQYPTRRVVYLHSKGSYHPSKENDKLRQFLTNAALSPQCAARTATTSKATTTTTAKTTCQVCSARFSPLPHAHVPGNMWLAQCDYIQHLLNPYNFEAAMDTVYPINVTHPSNIMIDDNNNTKKTRSKMTNHGMLDDRDFRNGEHMSCRGLGRFAAEHWLASHPDLLACDLYRHKTYTWGYGGLPEQIRPIISSSSSNDVDDTVDDTNNNTTTANTTTTSATTKNTKGYYDFRGSPAPRFGNLETYLLRRSRQSCPQTLRKRFDEYQTLYGKTPNVHNLTELAHSWWGWRINKYRTIITSGEGYDGKM